MFFPKLSVPSEQNPFLRPLSLEVILKVSSINAHMQGSLIKFTLPLKTLKILKPYNSSSYRIELESNWIVLRQIKISLALFKADSMIRSPSLDDEPSHGRGPEHAR